MGENMSILLLVAGPIMVIPSAIFFGYIFSSNIRKILAISNFALSIYLTAFYVSKAKYQQSGGLLFGGNTDPGPSSNELSKKVLYGDNGTRQGFIGLAPNLFLFSLIMMEKFSTRVITTTIWVVVFYNRQFFPRFS